MGFLDKDIKKRKRTKIHTSNQSSDLPKTIQPLIHTKVELPPDTNEPILTWEPPWGFAVYNADICRQHILEDRKTRIERIQYWHKILENYDDKYTNVK